MEKLKEKFFSVQKTEEICVKPLRSVLEKFSDRFFGFEEISWVLTTTKNLNKILWKIKLKTNKKNLP